MEIKEAIETIKNNYPPSNYTMLREALDMAVKQFEQIESGEYVKADGWISVEDRLPECDFEKYYREHITYPSYLVMIEGKYPLVLRYSDSHFGWHRGNDFARKDITHWQPLPAPPKGDK